MPLTDKSSIDKYLPILESKLRELYPGGPADECWYGSRETSRYAHVYVSTNVVIGMHKAAYRVFVGPILPGNVVRHTCDTPCCWNPSHLTQGTQSENVHDYFVRKKGRQFGPRKLPGNPKLTPEKVAEIRAKLKVEPKLIRAKLAREYGVSPSTITLIAQGMRW